MSDDPMPNYDSEAGKKYGEYDIQEIDRAADILLKADEIRADQDFYRLVTERLQDKAKRIRSISDLRDRMAEQDYGNKEA